MRLVVAALVALCLSACGQKPPERDSRIPILEGRIATLEAHVQQLELNDAVHNAEITALASQPKIAMPDNAAERTADATERLATQAEVNAMTAPDPPRRRLSR